MKLTLLVAAAATVLAACSSGSNGSAGDGGSADSAEASNANTDSASDAAPDDAASDGPRVCNTLANTAQPLTITQVASDPPAPQGGVISDGTYALTNATIYTGPQGPIGASGMGQTTIQIAGSTIEVVMSGSPATLTSTLSVGGTTFTATDTCGDTQVRQGTYTATPTSLVFFLPAGMDDAGARTLAQTYTKQ